MKTHIIVLCATAALFMAACTEPRGGPGGQTAQGWRGYRSGTWDSATERVRTGTESRDDSFNSSGASGTQSGISTDTINSETESDMGPSIEDESTGSLDLDTSVD